MSDTALYDEAAYAVRSDLLTECERLAEENEALRNRVARAEARLERIGRRRRNKAMSTVAVCFGLAVVVLLFWAVFQ